MKFLHIVSLVGMLWLTGCATTGGAPGVVSNAPDDTPTSSRPAHTPIIPKGPLQPIKAANASSQEVASLSTPADLWDRIRRGFAMPDLQHELVQDREQWYASRPDYMQRMTERSSKYLFHIVEELERRGMPTELALLPYIESAFNPQAVSSAKAAGMWQFMPATGKDFDLTQNMFRDDRRDVLASTRAALDYLERLNRQFNDWHLALAAYNWGQGNVAKAIKRNQAQGLGTSYTEINLPLETRQYVPKLQALKNIVAQPELFGLTLPRIPNRPYFVTVESRVALDLATAARLSETSVDEILALNPGYKRPVLPTNGSMSLVIPAEKVEAFLVNLQRHDPASASWKTYELREGEGLEGVADRLGISASRLRQVNGLSPRARIGTGYTLIIPSENEGDRITLSNLLPSRPQPGAVEPPPPRLVQHTTVRGKHGRMVVVERNLPTGPAPAVAGGRGKARAEAAPASRGKQAESRPEPKGAAKAAGSKPPAAAKAAPPPKAAPPAKKHR